jgi:hypothetical protein
MRFHEFNEDKGSTLASRTISRYADEIGSDSMDYDMFKKSAELLDAGKLKSLAQHLYNADTSPREYVMKVISKKDPDTFKKMYGDQEGYFSLMKPVKDLTDGEIEEGADFYGYYKDPKYPDKNYMTYPDDMEFKTPHRSNANVRMFLSRIGLDPDFENTGSTPIDDFIAATDKYLRMNVSDKESEEYDEVEMYHIEANRIKKQHPEVTHVGFN